MKKPLLFVTILGVVALSLGMAGFAYAQSEDPPEPEVPYGPGFKGGRGFGRMGWQAESGPIHDGLIASFAEALGMTPDELEARCESGESLWQVAESQGASDEDIRELMLSAHSEALAQAVDEGLITQEQAEWMLERQEAVAEAFASGEWPAGSMGQGGFMGRWGASHGTPPSWAPSQ